MRLDAFSRFLVTYMCLLLLKAYSNQTISYTISAINPNQHVYHNLPYMIVVVVGLGLIILESKGSIVQVVGVTIVPKHRSWAQALVQDCQIVASFQNE